MSLLFTVLLLAPSFSGGPGLVVICACLESRGSRVRPLAFRFHTLHSYIFSNVGSVYDQEVGCLASDRKGSNFDFIASLPSSRLAWISGCGIFIRGWIRNVFFNVILNLDLHIPFDDRCFSKEIVLEGGGVVSTG